MSNPGTTEEDLFIIENGVDFLGGLTLVFYDVTLRRDIGPFEKGDTFETAMINYEDGVLGLGDKKFELSLEVGDEIED